MHNWPGNSFVITLQRFRATRFRKIQQASLQRENKRIASTNCFRSSDLGFHISLSLSFWPISNYLRSSLSLLICLLLCSLTLIYPHLLVSLSFSLFSLSTSFSHCIYYYLCPPVLLSLVVSLGVSPLLSHLHWLLPNIFHYCTLSISLPLSYYFILEGEMVRFTRPFTPWRSST